MQGSRRRNSTQNNTLNPQQALKLLMGSQGSADLGGFRPRIRRLLAPGAAAADGPARQGARCPQESASPPETLRASEAPPGARGAQWPCEDRHANHCNL